MARFEGKQVIVTGAGVGIGRAIAMKIGSEGGVIHAFERDESSGEEVAKIINDAGGNAIAYSVDVSSESAVEAAVASIDRIDVLVNNAGIASVGNIEDTTGAEMDRVYDVNVKGVFHCVQKALPKMKSQGGGVILNMASIASRLGIKDRFAYSMTKGAVFAMTLSIAKDYVSHGIRCNCLCPARVHTPFVDAYLDEHFKDNKEEVFQELSAYQPIGRMADPEEIAELAAFLCSDAAQFITGSAYDIDGGVTNLR